MSTTQCPQCPQSGLEVERTAHETTAPPSAAIDPLHKWRLNLSNNTHTSLASHSCFKTKEFSHECEVKDVPSIVIQIYAPFEQRVYALPTEL